MEWPVGGGVYGGVSMEYYSLVFGLLNVLFDWQPVRQKTKIST